MYICTVYIMVIMIQEPPFSSAPSRGQATMGASKSPVQIPATSVATTVATTAKKKAAAMAAAQDPKRPTPSPCFVGWEIEKLMEMLDC